MMEQTVAIIGRESRQPSETYVIEKRVLDREEMTAALSTYRFKSSTHRELRNIRCETERGILIICGQVSSYYWKQLAQEFIRPFSKSMFIENQLIVGCSEPNDTLNKD